MLALPAEDIAASAEGSVPEGPACPVTASGAYWRAPITEGLLGSVLRLLRLFDAACHSVPRPGRPGARTRDHVSTPYRPAGFPSACPGEERRSNQQIARAIEVLKSDLARPVCVEQLAHVAQMSVTSFIDTSRHRPR